MILQLRSDIKIVKKSTTNYVFAATPVEPLQELAEAAVVVHIAHAKRMLLQPLTDAKFFAVMSCID